MSVCVHDDEDYRPLQAKLEILNTGGQRQLIIFKRQFLQRLENRHVQYPGPEVLRLVGAQKYIVHHILSKRSGAANVSTYDRVVWKTLLSKIEDAVGDMDDPEILDMLMDGYADMCVRKTLDGVSNDDLATVQEDVELFYPLLQYCYDFDIVRDSEQFSERYLCILEKPQVLSVLGGSAIRTWQAALFLAMHMLGEWPKSLLRGKVVLELGCGTGLISLLLSSLESQDHNRPQRVIATDGDTTAIERLLSTRQLLHEEAQSRLVPLEYLWGDDMAGITALESEGQKTGLVLASDVLYDPSVLASLVETIRKVFVYNEQAKVLICYAHRRLETALEFVELCASAGFSVERVLLSEAYTLESQVAYFSPTEVPVECIVLSSRTAAAP